MDGNTLFFLLVVVAVLLGGVLVVLCGILFAVKKAANEMITALQAIFDDLRKGQSP